jgi:hypothetical protein
MLIAHMTGVEGAVRWGYRTAARLGAWTYERGTLTAELLTRDDFALQQDPLTVSAVMGKATWRWLVTGVQINGSTLTASVVNQEG